jgi:murein DD-endopeptidase MepM/ murein hydrolase activator NlpD
MFTKEQLLVAINNTTDYLEIKRALRAYNASVMTNQNVFARNLADKSALSYVRDIINSPPRVSIQEPDELLGIILYIPKPITIDSGRIIQKIYIDVPLKDFVDIPHPDVFDPDKDTNLKKNLNFFEDLVFYPVSEKILKEDAPVLKGIARVKYGPFGFYDGITQTLGNKYLGMFSTINTLGPPPSYNANIMPKEKVALSIFRQKKTNALYSRKADISGDENYKLDLPWRGNYPITSLPNPRVDPLDGQGLQQHYALDIGMAKGVPVYAANDFIAEAPDIPPNGLIEARGHYGKFTYRYLHLSKRFVTTGQQIKRGDLIGEAGATGNTRGQAHLHFEVTEKGNLAKRYNPLFMFKPNKLLLDNGTALQYSFYERPTSITEQVGEKIFLKVPLPNANPDTLIPGVGVVTDDKPLSSKDGGTPNIDIQRDVVRPDAKATGTSGTAPPPQVGGQPPKSPNSPKVSRSQPSRINKLILKNYTVDLSNGVSNERNRGSKEIKIREDIAADLSKIKEILNDHGIALTCISQDLSLDNKNITLLSKVGLEFLLNKFAALTPQMNLDKDDYFIGPNYRHKIGNGYKLTIYAQARRTNPIFGETIQPKNLLVDIYDIRQTYKKAPPKIIKINKNLINLTELFESYGFVQKYPNSKFFLNSDYELSNWFYISKPNLIVKNYSYKELLATVYDNNNERIWYEPDIFWDGSNFINA